MNPEDFVRNRFDQLGDAIRTADCAKAAEIAEAVRHEYLAAHDGLRDVVGATLESARQMSSPEEAEAIGLAAIESIMAAGAGGDPPQYAHNALKERVRAIAAGWHWHATAFTLSEDDWKITFRLDPCGSGMRLLQEGAYDGETGWHRSVRPSPSTFMQMDFPLYSNHCAEMTRAALRSGAGTFLVEGWTPLRECGVCLQHTFKSVDDVPDEFYRRVGLQTPLRPATKRNPTRKRLFTAEELEQITVHPLDRLVRHVQVGEVSKAQDALEESLAAWRDSMQGAYRRWIGTLWMEIESRLGDEALVRVLQETGPHFLAHVRHHTAADWAAFWSIHLHLEGARSVPTGYEFILSPLSLLDQDRHPGYPGSVADFCIAMNHGLAARAWTDVGTFSFNGTSIVHSWPGN
jgi:hypothetical protein